MSQYSDDEIQKRRAMIEKAIESLPEPLEDHELEILLMGMVFAYLEPDQIPFYFMYLSQRFFVYQRAMEEDDQDDDLYGSLEDLFTDGGTIH